MRSRVLLGVSFAAVVGAAASCTTFDDLHADPQLIGEGNGTSSGGNGTCKNPPCVVGPNGEQLGGGKGAECTTGADCASTICEPNGTCTEATSLDGVKNGSETDVDCGGGVPTNAPKCLADKACKAAEDCLWGSCDGGKCSGDKPGVKDGDQTDVDCGGVHSPPCDWERSCQFDRDCAGGVCGPDQKCLVGPSCATAHGGTTCGTGELDDATKKHESCCKTLLVPGFTDARQPNKKVYLDKYEITAGRMRVFLEELAKKDPDGVPNVKAWITKNTPARWSASWTEMLPEGWQQGQLTYTTTTPTQNQAYPAQDQMAQQLPRTPQFTIRDGSWTISTGANFELGPFHFFPEYIAQGADPDYGGSHNLNCTTEDNSFGFSTFWFDAATFQAMAGAGQRGKAYTKEQMDEKALNCAPMGLFAAFCAWDGGQLMTDEVFDFVAGGPWPLNPVPHQDTGLNPQMPPQLAGLNAGLCPQGLNITPDSTQTCFGVYGFPNPGLGGTFDGSSRIAAPGRVAADAISLAGGEPWMDLKGNLSEGVFRADGRYHFRGLGIGYASTQAHRTQQSTPRMKTASMGARCMRFRDAEFVKP
ncbi:MAG: hypothetical protein KIT84_18235 [Labilithrix sp.]|nr:hypothetical protein [Labilithrix sp.]MCW5812972.1 hypothetical protein [Labilithrix sp.]